MGSGDERYLTSIWGHDATRRDDGIRHGIEAVVVFTVTFGFAWNGVQEHTQGLGVSFFVCFQQLACKAIKRTQARLYNNQVV